MVSQATARAGDLLPKLRDRIDTTLASLLAPGERCALLDYPAYTNVGDSAIWLGTRAALDRAGAVVAYAASIATYDPTELAARVGDGTILLSGGGNLGDLWLDHQVFRERVILDFPDNRVIQLPQSICFEHAESLQRARLVLGSHRRLTLLVRDRHSAALAADAFDAPVVLCPDMAFALEPFNARVEPSVPVTYLARTDKESAGHDDAALRALATTFDWLEPPPLRPSTALTWVVVRSTRARSLRLLDGAAWQRVARGADLLARGRVAVTDRLHGHVLCALLGLPHVVLRDAYGKARNLYETWTHEAPDAAWADDANEALALVAELTA